MKFIHISDIHIGMIPEPMMPWAHDRELDIKETFANVIKKCKEEDADLLLISGDLFNHQPVTEELDMVNNLFKEIYDTKVLIVAGSSDYIKSSSPILNYKFSDNVYYFLNEFPEEVDIKETKIVIHGFSYFKQEEKSSMINSINVPNDKKIHILLAYGGEKKYCPIDFDSLSQKNFAYCALGSNHMPKIIIDNKAAYAGSLEPLEASETGMHGIYIGEINDTTCRLSSLKFVKMAKLSYISININIVVSSTEDDVIKMVNDEINKAGINNIYKITLTGMRDPDIEFSINLFDKKIRIVDFIDNTEPQYDFVKLSSEHPQDMIGAYTRKFLSRKKALTDIEKNALYYGVNALINASKNDK